MAKNGYRKRFRETESKYAEGTELRNGTVVRHPPRDLLDERARIAEKLWLDEQAKATKPRKGSRASGTNPRALGTNPRAMR